jgi:L-ascorbate 6-phosphate lactonase
MVDSVSERSSLLREIEDSKSTDTLRIWGLSGAGFAVRFKDDIVFIDPWLVTPDPKRTTHRNYPIPFPPGDVRQAKAVISTHEHEDHCNVATVTGIVNSSGARFIGPQSAVSKVTSGGLPQSKTVTVSPGSLVEISPSMKIRAFESQDPYDPLAVMIMIETSRGNILHSGDTSYFPGFAEIGNKFKVDVALLNYGKQIPNPEKPYYMNAKKIAMAARDLRAKILIPMHYNLWVELREDPNPIREVLHTESPETQLRIVEGGDLLEI